MLREIQVRDFTIIDRIELALNPGMTVLTGETGAGKSIIIDAVGIALGERAEAGVVRNGGERAEIQLAFDIALNPAAQAWLKEHELDADEECVIRRTIQREGGSRAYINGRAAPVQQLRELGDLLIDIHGQHQHQSLLKKDVQRDLLDRFGGHGALALHVAKASQQWRSAKNRLDELTAQRATRDERMAYLRYQVQEFENLRPVAGEWEKLEADYNRLSNVGELTAQFAGAIQQIDESDNALTSRVNRLIASLSGLAHVEKGVNSVVELLNNATIQLSEAVGELRDLAEGLELDPQRLAQLEQRLRAMHDLARKHRVSEVDLPDLFARYSQELSQLDHSDAAIDELTRDIKKLEQDYQSLASELSKHRQKAAKTLSGGITQAMRELGMPGGEFAVELARDDIPPCAAFGLERVEFLVSTNPGQPRKSLTKVVSGGELSRISLAIQVIAAQVEGIPTLIFDEVDVGIGGGIAETVGEKLRLLGERRQILCVTHLPQVAAQGHQHWRVQKETQQNSTYTRIAPLSPNERVTEVERMLGGVEITAKTKAHAKEMLDRAQRARETMAVPE